jgi:hypothetical protein
MHEAGAVAAAIDEAFDAWPSLASDGRMTVQIVDPTRAEARAVAFYARALLSELGLDGMTLSVRTDAVECRLCGAASVPTPVEPLCDACGAPLPRSSGPAIVCQPDEAADASQGGVERCA